MKRGCSAPRVSWCEIEIFAAVVRAGFWVTVRDIATAAEGQLEGTVRLVCARLVRQGILRSKRVGRGLVFRVNDPVTSEEGMERLQRIREAQAIFREMERHAQSGFPERRFLVFNGHDQPGAAVAPDIR